MRELAQPYNFSLDNDGTGMSFIVPVWTADLTDAEGYASVTLSSREGPEAELRKTLFYTEDCPKRGWFGRGLDCRPCIKGGYCMPMCLHSHGMYIVGPYCPDYHRSWRQPRLAAPRYGAPWPQYYRQK